MPAMVWMTATPQEKYRNQRYHFFIHGEKDIFVPCWMCEEIYQNCASPKTKLIVKDAGHGESYFKDATAYEQALDSFIGGIMK